MLLTVLVCWFMTQGPAITYTNPVYPHNFPDPFITEDRGTFYAFGTHAGPDGFQALTSRDLIHWEAQPAVGKPSWSSDQLWAPEAYSFAGRWYLFYSARNAKSGKRDLAVSVADRPLGPYTDLAVLVLGTSENPGSGEDGAIDPTVFTEGGKHYLLYIREAAPRSLKIVELAPDFRRTVGEAKVLITADRPEERGILDAPTLIKRDGAYWLLYSGGWFQSFKKDACYRVWSARAKSLFGPYVKQPKPVLDSVAGQVYSPGHQCVFETSSGEWWMAYHAWNADGEPMYGHNAEGRSLRLDRLTWTDSGPHVAGPTTSPQPAPKLQIR